MKNQLFQWISTLAIVAYFLPLMIVLIRRLWTPVPFLLFALYWAVGGITNLISNLPGISFTTIEKIGVGYNLIDMPMVLAIFYYSTNLRYVKKLIMVFMPVILLGGCVSTFVWGMKYESLKYVLGLGLLLTLIVVICEIVRNLQKIQHTVRMKAMLLICAALLFQYGIYTIIYIFDYLIPEKSNETDNYLIYYTSTILSNIVAAIAYLLLKKQADRPNNVYSVK